MSRLVPYRSSTGFLQDGVPHGVDAQISTRLEALSKYVPVEILTFYVSASAAAPLAGTDLSSPLQWITFFIGWIAVPVYILSIAHGDERGPRQAFISSIAFPIWVMNLTSIEFWPVPYMPRNPGLALWSLFLFSLMTALLPPPTQGRRPKRTAGLAP